MNHKHNQSKEEISGLSTTIPSQNETNSGASNLQFTETTTNFSSFIGGQCLNPPDL